MKNVEKVKWLVVEGPCRDYDEAWFCTEHCNEAYAFASEWVQEQWDNLDAGEDRTFMVRAVAGDGECCICADAAKGRS